LGGGGGGGELRSNYLQEVKLFLSLLIIAHYS